MHDEMTNAVVVNLENATCQLIGAEKIDAAKYSVLYRGSLQFCEQILAETALPQFHLLEYLKWRRRTDALVYFSNQEFFYTRYVEVVVMAPSKASAMRAVDLHRGKNFEPKIRTHFERTFRITVDPDLIRVAQANFGHALFSSARGKRDFALHEAIARFPRPAWDNPFNSFDLEQIRLKTRRPIVSTIAAN